MQDKKQKKANGQEESKEQEDIAFELEHLEVEESGQDPMSSIKKKKKSFPKNEAQVADKEESDRQVPSNIKKTRMPSAVVEGGANKSPSSRTVKSPPTRKASLVVEEQSNQSPRSSIKKTKTSPKRKVSVKAESINKDSFAFKKQNTPQKRESTTSSVGDVKRKTAFFRKRSCVHFCCSPHDWITRIVPCHA